MIRYIRWRLACRRLTKSLRPDPKYMKRRRAAIKGLSRPYGRIAILMARDLREAGI